MSDSVGDSSAGDPPDADLASLLAAFGGSPAAASRLPTRAEELGELLETRGMLATFAAEGLGGVGDSCRGSARPSADLSRPAGGQWGQPPVPVYGFDTGSDQTQAQAEGEGGAGRAGLDAGIELAAPAPAANGSRGAALTAGQEAKMPELLQLSRSEQAVKQGKQERKVQ